MSCEVARYRPEFLPMIAELLTEFWPDRQTNAACFDWLHRQNPYSESPLAYLLIDDGRAVGMRAFHAARWEIAGSGRTFDVPCACMFVVRKEVRGRGYAHRITNGAVEDLRALGYRHVFAFSSAPIPFMSQARRGWRIVAHYHTLRRAPEGALRSVGGLVRRLPVPRRFLRYMRRARATIMPGPYAKLDQSGTLPIDGGILSVATVADAEAMSALSDQAQRAGPIRHLRDADFFRWRFLNPRMSYRFLFLRDPSLRGFLVLQTPHRNPQTVNIVDWEAESDGVLQSLFRAAVELGQFGSLAVWSTAVSADMAKYLGSVGFEPIDESRGMQGYMPGFQIRCLGDASAEDSWKYFGRRIDDLANWDLRPAKSDAF